MTGRRRRSTILYCDGACRGNPGPGAYAVLLRSGRHEKQLAGVVRATTNNRMELLAAISGLEILSEPCQVTVVTDSEYVKKGMTEWVSGWMRNNWLNSQRQPVRNKELWERLVAAASRHEVSWSWVRGHDGDPLNERCDRLANDALDAWKRGDLEAIEDDGGSLE